MHGMQLGLLLHSTVLYRQCIILELMPKGCLECPLDPGTIVHTSWPGLPPGNLPAAWLPVVLSAFADSAASMTGLTLWRKAGTKASARLRWPALPSLPLVLAWQPASHRSVVCTSASCRWIGSVLMPLLQAECCCCCCCCCCCSSCFHVGGTSAYSRVWCW